MGVLNYGAMQIEIDDRTLAHLQIVIVQKLRRKESFTVSWRDAPETGDGRSTIWIDTAIPLYFKYHGSRQPKINRAWLEQLMESANSANGMDLADEPDAEIKRR